MHVNRSTWWSNVRINVLWIQLKFMQREHSNKTHQTFGCSSLTSNSIKSKLKTCNNNRSRCASTYRAKFFLLWLSIPLSVFFCLILSFQCAHNLFELPCFEVHWCDMLFLKLNSWLRCFRWNVVCLSISVCQKSFYCILHFLDWWKIFSHILDWKILPIDEWTLILTTSELMFCSLSKLKYALVWHFLCLFFSLHLLIKNCAKGCTSVKIWSHCRYGVFLL